MDLQLSPFYQQGSEANSLFRKKKTTYISLIIACATVLPGSIWQRGINSSRPADEPICFPGLRSTAAYQGRCHKIQTRSPKHLHRAPATRKHLPAWLGGPEGAGHVGAGDSTSCPAAPRCFPASYSLAAHLQARRAGRAAAARSACTCSYLCPPLENSLLYAYFCIASYLPGRASALFAVRNPMYNQTFNVVFLCCLFFLFYFIFN